MYRGDDSTIVAGNTADSTVLKSTIVDTHIPFSSNPPELIPPAPKEITYGDTVKFVPPITSGIVIKVYDGDTITIASTLPNQTTLYRFSVRLLGIDCPEIKGKTTTEKELAIRARTALHELIYGRFITLKDVSTEKYGRILANVYLDSLCVNQWMLDHGYAVPYDGGTKQRPAEWDE
jgi:endonuclease YncB( thermonuclease family)